MDVESIVVGIVLIGMLGAGIYSSVVVDRHLRDESLARRKAEEERNSRQAKKKAR